MKRYRYIILALLVSCTFINYIDRAALSIAAPYIMKEFSFTPSQMGTIFSSFSIGYAIFCFIGGYFSDICGPRKTIAVAMILWSFFAGAPAIAWGFTSLFIFRVLFGMGEGPVSSVSNKMINNWFPATERAKAKGITDSGMSLGAAVAGPIVAFIALQWGWRVSFLALTAFGLIWACFWLKLATDMPGENHRVLPAEVKEIEQGKVTVSTVSSTRPFTYFIKQPVIIVTILAFFACNYITYFFLSWFPSYLVMAHNLSIKDMSIVNIIPWLGGALGFALGGFLSDYVYKKVGDLIFSRKIVITVFLIAGAAAIGLCGVVTSAALAVTLMSLGIFFAYLTIPSYWAIIQDVVRGDKVGSVGGFVHFLSNIAGIVAPSITGFIVEGTGQFTSAFFLSGGLAVAGALAVGLFAKPIQDSDSAERASA